MTSFNFLHLFNDCSNVYVSRRKFMPFKSLLPEGEMRKTSNALMNYPNRISFMLSAQQYYILLPCFLYEILFFLLTTNFPSFSGCAEFLWGYYARVFERVRIIFERLSVHIQMLDFSLH